MDGGKLIRRDAARGFTVEQGFSGGPVLDDLGNVVLGMIAAVDAKGRGVAYAVPAEDLWRALQAAFFRQMRAFRTQSTPAWSRRCLSCAKNLKLSCQASRQRKSGYGRSSDRLRQGVQRIGEEARGSQSPRAEAALDALARGDARSGPRPRSCATSCINSSLP